MTKNEGNIDRILRVIVGAGLLAYYFFGPGEGWGGIHALALIGIVPLVTGLVGTCPLYSVLGVSTCPMKKS
jgi:hypothetical protein